MTTIDREKFWQAVETCDVGLLREAFTGVETQELSDLGAVLGYPPWTFNVKELVSRRFWPDREGAPDEQLIKRELESSTRLAGYLPIGNMERERRPDLRGFMFYMMGSRLENQGD